MIAMRRVEGQLQNGKGKMLYANGDLYEGGWVNDKKEGYGKLKIIINGIEYVGNFKSDKFHGEGIYKTAIGDSYEGSWIKGKKEGKGIFISSIGDNT